MSALLVSGFTESARRLQGYFEMFDKMMMLFESYVTHFTSTYMIYIEYVILS